EDRPPNPGEARAAEALTAGSEAPPPPLPEEGEEIEIDARLTMSGEDRLATRDFEQMTAAEMAEAKRAIARLALPVRPIASRRTRPAREGRTPDWRATMRRAMRRGGQMREIAMRTRRERWPALVCLCDISGSMAGYSRMLLHFLHAAANAKGAGWSKVHAFTFGTRLTNITRHLAARDVDEALARAGREATDWEGGTRIGAALETFNRDWSRRVLGQGAVVLLITDGLERDDPARLSAAAERLSLSCRRLIWLNPLLRWDGFEAKAAGVRALLPHVDSFRASHSIDSLRDLADTLARPEDAGEKARLLAGMARG
ncbi:MAG: VWA domain-containing protein, partial [Pseudomonadota bacterium]